MVRGKCKIVGYLRTSTDDQRLSIDAQRETVQRIAQDGGCEVSRVYLEHESGGNNQRPELDNAIKHARRVGAVLVVAKLDRLARDSQFLMRLYDGDVPIMFGDLPEVDGSAAGRLMVQMMANIAEFERRRMGERMKDWHRERRAQNLEPGYKSNLTQDARERGAENSARKRREKARDDMSDVAQIVVRMRSEGSSLQSIADYLNAESIVARKGGMWSRTQVQRVLDRATKSQS
jgi:DNA invertase Pin-like site-specific DNA recombinase